MRPEPPLVFHPSSFADLPLDLLIDRIDGGLGDDAGFLVTLRGIRTGLELGIRPLEGEHPVDALLGFRAPPEVDALGVVVSGTAHHLGPPADPGDRDDLAALPGGRVRIIQIHARDGRSASRLRSIGTDPPPVVDTVAADGDVADCVRRALDLPTPPPPHPPVVWWAIDWLDALLDHACRDPSRRWTWRDVAALHPLAGSHPPDSPSSLVATVGERSEGLAWSGLRLAAADAALAAEGPPCPIGPDLAAWMDDGMFARWLLGSRPEPVDVVVDLV
ncbi:MAG: hypothetical protein JO291_02925, partial [Acidimicrobiia bacterium]|nr:hypothetical protein [Acidimicrobiia bacterium]